MYADFFVSDVAAPVLLKAVPAAPDDGYERLATSPSFRISEKE